MKTIRQRLDEKIEAMTPEHRAAGRDEALVDAVDEFFADQAVAQFDAKLRELGIAPEPSEPWPSPFPDLPPLPDFRRGVDEVPGVSTTTSGVVAVAVDSVTVPAPPPAEKPARKPKAAK